MTKLIFLIIIAIIGIITYLSKRAAGAVSNKKSLKDATIKKETKNIMDKTARGLNWLNEQWEKSKRADVEEHEQIPLNSSWSIINCPNPHCKQKLTIRNEKRVKVKCKNCGHQFNYIP